MTHTESALRSISNAHVTCAVANYGDVDAITRALNNTTTAAIRAAIVACAVVSATGTIKAPVARVAAIAKLAALGKEIRAEGYCS